MTAECRETAGSSTIGERSPKPPDTCYRLSQPLMSGYSSDADAPSPTVTLDGKMLEKCRWPEMGIGRLGNDIGGLRATIRRRGGRPTDTDTFSKRVTKNNPFPYNCARRIFTPRTLLRCSNALNLYYEGNTSQGLRLADIHPYAFSRFKTVQHTIFHAT